jgi:O-antigen/teichoic acid export membrane protein
MKPFRRLSQKFRLFFERFKIAKNAGVVLVAQIVCQGLLLVYVAFLARYVGADGIGKISIANTLNGLLILIVAPGFTTLLVRDIAARHEQSGNYLANMLWIKFSLGLIFILVTQLVSRLVNYPSYTIAVITIYSLIYFIDSLGSLFVSMFQAFERMEFEAAGQALQTVLNVTLSLVAIYLHLSLLIICLISLLAVAFKLLFFVLFSKKSLTGFAYRINFKFSQNLLTASFPFGGLIILATIKLQSGPFILSLFKQESEVGLFSAANSMITMLLYLPIAVSSAIYPVFSKFAVSSRSDLEKIYKLYFQYILMLGFAFGIGTILVGGKFILLIYGPNFQGAIPTLQILGVFLFTLVGYSNGPLLKVIGRQHFLMWTEGMAVLAQILLTFLLGPLLGANGVAISFVIAGFGTFIVHSRAAHQYFGLNFPWMIIGKVAFTTSIMGLAVFILLSVGVSWPLIVFFLAPLIYASVARWIGLIRRADLIELAGASSTQTYPAKKPDEFSMEEYKVIV